MSGIEDIGFVSAPVRLIREREERLERAQRRLRYHVSFLDDCLRGIGQNDLVVLGAETGAGKTDLATAVAKANARAGKRVCYFALEAERTEIERRAKYGFIGELAHRERDLRANALNYVDWMTGRIDDVAAQYESAADRLVREQLKTLYTYYRGPTFTLGDIQRCFPNLKDLADLVVLDHLHYVDLDDDKSENRACKQIVQTIRSLAIDIGVPVILVAHLRKRDLKARQVVPHVEDFHGSSDLTKTATHCIQFAPARGIERAAPWLAPTYMHVPKDRHGGATGLVALCEYDHRYRRYATEYTLGRLAADGTRWEPIKAHDVPTWARNHRSIPT